MPTTTPEPDERRARQHLLRHGVGTVPSGHHLRSPQA
ncbi:hypothetical protein FHS40_007991 [Streptomyces spectabilis]|uniref:Uncharacterized protein n=1 Tax=Streptomyces spectabilis TaxID=68270 RepID=A0A7W8EZK7_STRST|nr:hypothetical protein [Streptomyces spectabilis]